MNNTFGNVTQHFIKNVMTKNNTYVLALIMFDDMIHTKANKYFRVLSCVIYTIIDNYVCIDYISCQLKKLSEICVYGKYLVKYFNELFGIGIPYLLTNLLLCHGFTNNIKCIVLLKCPRSVLEYYFQKDLIFWNVIQII